MGIPFHGWSWTLFEPQDNGYHALVVGPGIQGPHTRTHGFLHFSEICLKLNEGGWKVNRDEHFKVPYMVKNDQWVTYDDVQSVKEKVEFLIDKQLAGAMVWSIDADDFRNFCGDGNFPMLRTITNQFNNGSDCDYSLDQVIFNLIKKYFIYQFYRFHVHRI